MKTLLLQGKLLAIASVSLLSISLHAHGAQLPDPSDALIYQLKESLVKVSIATNLEGTDLALVWQLLKTM